MALLYGAEKGHTSTVELLLDKGAEIKYKDEVCYGGVHGPVSVSCQVWRR